MNSKVDEKDVSLPPLTDGEICTVIGANSIEKFTKPPAAYTEGDLITEMESASKFVEDPELRKILKVVSGLGTAATRASIIEQLKAHKYLMVSGKQIIPTEKGISFINWIKSISPELTDVAETARWQAKLDIIEKKGNRDSFEKEIENFVKNLVTIFKAAPSLGGTSSSENNMAESGKPTEKMVEYAKKIAAKTGKRLPDEVTESYEACKKFIDDNKDSANAPSEKQVKFAESIGAKKGVAVPKEVLADSRLLSKWIDENK